MPAGAWSWPNSGLLRSLKLSAGSGNGIYRYKNASETFQIGSGLLVLHWGSSKQPRLRRPSQLKSIVASGLHLVWLVFFITGQAVQAGGWVALDILARLRGDWVAGATSPGPWEAGAMAIAKRDF